MLNFFISLVKTKGDSNGGGNKLRVKSNEREIFLQRYNYWE